MSGVLVLGFIICMLITIPVPAKETGLSQAVSPVPQEEAFIENPVSVKEFSLPDFQNILNDAEKELVVQHPLQAAQVYRAASKAEETTIRLYGCNGYQDSADAYKHCLWNALMKKYIGQDAAREWANAHEYCSEGVDKEMDLFNNEVGRSIAVETKSEEQIINEARELVSTGQCLRIVDGHLESTG